MFNRPTHRIIESIFALALTPACGAELATEAIDGRETIAVQTQALQDEEDEVQLPHDVVNKVTRTYQHLKAVGALPENSWRLDEQAPEQARYGHVELENDYDRGVYDGYAVEALVPVESSGEAADSFYVLRAGGVGGWQFLAGPFPMDSK